MHTSLESARGITFKFHFPHRFEFLSLRHRTYIFFFSKNFQRQFFFCQSSNMTRSFRDHFFCPKTSPWVPFKSGLKDFQPVLAKLAFFSIFFFLRLANRPILLSERWERQAHRMLGIFLKE
jgi:hypothetical protein